MEPLELVQQGLSKLRTQPWLTVGECSAGECSEACEWNRATQHKRCGPRERADVVHAQTTCRLTSRLLADIQFVSSPDQFSFREC